MTQCHRKMVSRRRVAGATHSLVSDRGLQFERARVLHKTLLKPILRYSSETKIWKEKERSSIRAVRMDNLIGLLGIRRMDKVPNAQIRKLCKV